MAFAVLAVVVVVVLVAVGGGGGDGEQVETADAPAAAAPDRGPVEIFLTAPSGWAESDDGRTVAEDDLTAEDPSGPRVRLVETDDDTDPVEVYLEAEQVAPQLALDVEEATVADFPTVSVAVHEDLGGVQFVRGYLLLYPPNTEPTLVVLEAPLDRWEDEVGTLVDTVDHD